jgi:KaiC/GvpD/RAD55 family RecA-like ATPase
MPRSGMEGRLAVSSLLGPSVKCISIKGFPGAGKTTLALALLEIAGGGLYVSTRASEARLTGQYPYVKHLIASGKARQARRDAATVRFEDLRLGRVTDIVESVLDAIHREKRPLVVLDSWDALANELDAGERLKAERALAAMAEASESKIVFVSETPEVAAIDYVADAIVVLHDVEREGRRYRRMEWRKIRGVEIPQESYLFTLAGGRFTMFQRPPSLPPGFTPKPFKPIPHSPTHYSTGSEDFDKFLEGGIRRGACITSEHSVTFPAEWRLPLGVSIRCNFLVQGGSCVVIPSANVTADMVRESATAYLGREVVESNLRVGQFEAEKRDPYFFTIPTDSIEECFETLWSKVDELKHREESREKPCVIFIGVDTLEYFYGPEGIVKQIVASTHRVRRFGDCLFLVMPSDLRVTRQLSDLSDIYLKIDMLEGSPIIYSEKPPSRQFMHLGYDYSEGYPKVKLTPIV